MQHESPRLRLRAEQTANMALNGVAGALSGLFGALAMAGALVWIEAARSGPVAVWIGLLAIAYAVHIGTCLRWRRCAFSNVTPFVAVALAEGVIWGLGIVWFCATGTLEQELVVVLLAGGIAGAVGLSFGSTMPAYLARFLPATLPYVVWAAFAAHGHAALHDLLAACVLAFALGNVHLSRGFNASFMAVHRARFAVADMAEDLRAQKETAEAATLAKSRFLAAASHDLRQPIHALGLFVGALHNSGLPPAARSMVDHIGASVTALDSLFAALMDISRLDAGALRPTTGAFPLAPLLQRICRDHAAEAAAKGIVLRLHAGAAIVASDAVLLERILRNLIANAVRYTDAGRVVVLCRPAAGGLSDNPKGAVSIQVWDSGCGIPEAEQARVFEEFHQVSRPDRQRERGLGLGLSIVQRLCVLLGLGLAFRSVPGRGTCFRLTVPLASGEPAADPAADPPPASGFILVIDDNPAITQSMAALLSGWGHDVACAEDLEGALRSRAMPDLIICDYHLASDTGLSVIAALRARYGRTIPAMLITADTSPGVAAAAAADGLVVLHKPVSNGRLRAFVGRVLARG